MDPSAPPAKKVCKVCCSEIAQKARKCPCCHSFQDFRSKMVFSPLFGVLIGIVPLVFVFVMLSRTFDKGENFDEHRSKVTISNTEIRFGESQQGPTVAVIGQMRNASNVPWKDINIHVEFRNAKDQRVDVGDRKDHYFQLPANAASAFKISMLREFPQSEYLKTVVYVVSAKDARARF